MGRINRANIKKATYFLKRNGLKRTWYAVRERLQERKRPSYLWHAPSEEELAKQREQAQDYTVTFSILVPAYRTGEVHLREMIESLRSQTYPSWELILADATEDDRVERVVRTIEEPRVRYIRLEKNAGIAENTNQGLAHVTGDYVGLLDHDDVLCENALYEMAAQIEAGKQRGIELQMLYSDEDKCNGDRTEYFEPNFKEDFNLDLLLSNNYICHFLVMKRELMQSLKFRPEYDGAQDFDLVLRAAFALKDREELIVHIPRVLYHWRCHTGSTAENPRSKLYAYEAGKRAILDFAKKAGWRATVENTAHVGFYQLQYEGNPFESRRDVGAIGGRLTGRGKAAGGRLTGCGICGLFGGERVVSGRIDSTGKVLYENLPAEYSGYLHRAVLPQNAAAVDIRNIRVREECRDIFEKVTGVPYKSIPGTDVFDASALPGDCDFISVSLALGEALRREGYRILYLPRLSSKIVRMK